MSATGTIGIKAEDRVDVAPFQAYVAKRVSEGISMSELASMAGAKKEKGGGRWDTGDTSWLQRRIGLIPEQNGVVKTYVSYPVAVRLVRGWGEDPVDFDV